jgi:hypothetical protein
VTKECPGVTKVGRCKKREGHLREGGLGSQEYDQNKGVEIRETKQIRAARMAQLTRAD